MFTSPTPNGNIQAIDLTLAGWRGADAAVARIAIPSHYDDPSAGVPPGPPRNVAHLYTQLAVDINGGTSTVPDFEHAVQRHRLIDTIESAAQAAD